ncbi:hypothetical protein FOMPIDRAFT_84037 [Fomitopsis schrenkii]|uniref:Uncharacterized protein n=1 Tax=Fomitopsis schrenkii TaxID=2126942 RepID=S8EL68_FOMSC|nr:hypothetical protein FOMPIDRAFT_84037 [Fomitopsis schrenkii]
MAPLLSFPSVGLSSPVPLDVPPPSQEPAFAQAAVPDVFVIPPEEEQDENPPFCYFNAADAAHDVQSTTPDIDALETALHLYQQLDNRAPTFRRSLKNDSQETIILPRRGSLAFVRENTVEEQWERPRRRVVDEDVVEVFKVRRNEGRSEASDAQSQGMKKSRTLRLRASEAFKSIKNVGKAPRRPSASKSSISWGSQENVRPARRPEQATQRDDLPQAGPQKLNRRKSLTLSQVFTFSQNHRPTPPTETDSEIPTCSSLDVANTRRSEGDILRDTVPRPSTPTIPRRKSLMFTQLFTFSPGHRPTLAESDPDVFGLPAEGGPLPRQYNMQTMPAITSPSKLHSQRIRPSPSIEDYGLVRAESPTTPVPPTRLSKRRSFRNRISVLDLQKIFSQAPSAPAPPRSSTDLAASTATFSSSFSLVSAGSLSEDDLRRRSADRAPAEDPFGSGDELDMEMRLDSLHFDSLHFDPEEFDLQL